MFDLLKFPTEKSDRLFLTPGNHDVSIALSAASRLEYLGDEKDTETEGTAKLPLEVTGTSGDQSLNELAYRPFKDAEQSLSDRSFYLSSDKEVSTQLSWAENRFGLLGLVFYGLNTARPIVPGRKCGRLVSEDDIAELTEWLGNQKREFKEKHDIDLYCIGLFHHHTSRRPLATNLS